MGCWVFFRIFVNLKKILKGKIEKKILKLMILIIVGNLIFTYILIENGDFFVQIFLQGLGILDTSSHSSSIRINNIKIHWKFF